MSTSRISRIETFAIPPRWLFVRIETDDGLVGWGEASLEGHSEAVEGVFVAIRERLLGADPCRIEDIWQLIHRGGYYRGGPVLLSALSGTDQALWDIKGKRFGVPVYELLGGQVRDRVPVYAWLGGDAPDAVSKGAKARLSQGFKSVKMNATGSMAWLNSPHDLDQWIDKVREVQALGLSVALDFHGRLHRTMAKQLVRLLEPLRPLFIEEPLLSEHPDAYRQLAGLTSIPIAAGERLYSRWDVKPFFEAGLIDIVQPDVSHAGGISEVRRIAAMAEAYDVALAPHCPLGPIAFCASLQVAFATPNFAMQEMPIGIHYNSDAHDLLSYMHNPEILEIDEGTVAAPQGPGLGIVLDEDKVRDLSKDCPPWRNPVQRGRDGSLREW